MTTRYGYKDKPRIASKRTRLTIVWTTVALLLLLGALLIPYGWVAVLLLLATALGVGSVFAIIGVCISVAEWVSSGFWTNPYNQMPWRL